MQRLRVGLVLGWALIAGGGVTGLANDTAGPQAQIESRLAQESRGDWVDPNSPVFLKALGQREVTQKPQPEALTPKTLLLSQCLQQAFVRNSRIKQVREGILALGGSQLIVGSRFLPSVNIVTQLERELNQTSDEGTSLATMGAVVQQRLLEYGKDHPIDVSLRQEQRDALFAYEDTVALTFSNVRRAFYVVLLKQAQINTRQTLLSQFQQQYERKQKRLDAGNLSVKIEVLTARLNVLNEQTQINALQRELFNRKMDLMHLIGLPVGADQVTFQGESDPFGLETFDMDLMISLALAQSTQVCLAELLVTEQSRVLDQLKYEYFPDLRMTAGYQNANSRMGLALNNQNDTWGLDAVGQGGLAESRRDMDGLGYFSQETTVAGPGEGWHAGLQARIPVFEGRARQGRRIQNKSYLLRLRAALAESRDIIELQVRSAYRLLAEQQFQVQLAQENVAIEKERFAIQEQLRDVGRIDDDALETFRERFFFAQDRLFNQQEFLIKRQEDLREAIRIFR
ncbi:MAG: TolC family protein [Phycisphaerae bacterium]|nr:TolC family protein [Phycisphaerae bacterium]